MVRRSFAARVDPLPKTCYNRTTVLPVPPPGPYQLHPRRARRRPVVAARRAPAAAAAEDR